VKRNAADGLFTRPSILRSVKAIYQGWVEKYLGNGNNIRDDKWTKGIAVGSKGFVEHVSLLSALLPKAERPRGQETAISFESPQPPYGEHFGVKNEDIGLKNTYFWNFNPE
jgi:hypothetical protein